MKALILHGWEASPDGHWMPWLKDELEKKDFEVHIPALSNPEYPVLEEQLDDLADIELNSGDIIIGHSLGCQLALQLVEQRKLEWVKVILVAPTYHNLADELWEAAFGDAYQKLYDYYNAPNNFWQLNKLDNTYTILLSDNDPYINQFTAQEYYKPLEESEVILCSWKWHFNTTAGILELPEILKYI